MKYLNFFKRNIWGEILTQRFFLVAADLSGLTHNTWQISCYQVFRVAKMHWAIFAHQHSVTKAILEGNICWKKDLIVLKLWILERKFLSWWFQHFVQRSEFKATVQWWNTSAVSFLFIWFNSFWSKVGVVTSFKHIRRKVSQLPCLASFIHFFSF